MHPAEVRNCILQSLRPDILAGLQPYLRRVRLKRGQMLQEPHRPLDRVYFIERGMAVLMARTKRDAQVGVGIIGRAGLVGVPVVLGIMRSPHHCVMEVEGEALQIGAETFRLAMDGSSTLRQQLMNYVHALLVQQSQTVLCNARHQLMERLTRLLLLAHDRLDDDTIPLTHDLLSMMLGVRRAGITTALDRLERSGAVRKTRGALEIVDRARLEQTTCECYRIIAAEHQRVIEFRPWEEMLERHGNHSASAQ
jgi:CRP-like cAMP-binding protein